MMLIMMKAWVLKDMQHELVIMFLNEFSVRCPSLKLRLQY